MKKMVLNRMLMSLVVACGCVSAWGSDFTLLGQGPGNDATRAISYEELKARCEHPEDFDVQKAPQNIKIQCTDVRREWVPSAPGEVPLPGTRRVVTGLFADKFHVGAQAISVPVFSRAGSCQRFKEIEKSLTIERPLSCGEIIGMKSSIQDFCIAALDAAKSANPKLVEVRELDGRLIDTCGAVQGGGGKQ